MKLLYTILLTLLIGNYSLGQWQETQTSLVPNETVYDITEHNGNLYGAINSKGLIKYNGTNWDSVALAGFTLNLNSIHIERIASNNNYLYAVVQNQSCASSMIYKSTDNGLTFTLDTSGLPLSSCTGNTELENVSYIYSLNDYMVIVMNSGTYYKKTTDVSWTANTNPNTMFAEFWAEYNNKWYAWYNYKLHVSSDKGVTWTTPTNTNIPSFYLAKVVNVNNTTGRIYLGGHVITTSEPKMFYSDNEGATWDSVAINQYITTDWIGTYKQKILDITSNGNNIYVNLVNNANGSHPDILVSSDNGASFSIDTAGLPSNSFGTVASRKMTYYNNELYIALNYNDVYKQTTGSSTSIKSTNKFNNYTVYPNPAKDILNISNLNPKDKVQLLDYKGNIIIESNNNSIKLSTLPHGVYLIKVITEDNIFVKKIIKN